MNRTRTAVLSFVLVAGAGILAGFIGYLIRLILARNLSVAQYGLVYAIMTFFGIAAVLLHWGLGEALNREAALTRGARAATRMREAFGLSTRVLYTSSAIVSLVIALGAHWLARSYFQDASATGAILIYTLAFLLSPINYMLMGIFIGSHRTDLSSALLAGGSLLNLVFVWLLLPFGITGILGAYAITLVLVHIIFLPLLGKAIPGFWRAKVRLRLTTVRRLMNYGIPVMIAGLAGMVISSTDTLLLTYFSTLEQVGLYQAAQPTASVLLILGGTLTTVLLPLLTDIWRRKQRGLFAASITDLYGYALIATLPMIAIVLVYPDLLLNLLFGAAYTQGAVILMWLIGASLFLTLNAVATTAFSAIGKPSITAQVVGIGAVANLLLNFALIPSYGGVGAAIATLISSVLIFTITFVRLRREYPVRIEARRWLGAVLGSVFVALVLMLARSQLPIDAQYFKALVALIIAGCVYVGALLLTRAFTIAEGKDLLTRILGAKASVQQQPPERL